MNIASAVEEPAVQADFFNEKGLLRVPTEIHACSFKYIQ